MNVVNLFLNINLNDQYNRDEQKKICVDADCE